MRIADKSWMRKYLSAEAGVAAIEFAVILPFILLLYFGLLDLTGLVSANRKMTSTSSVLADLAGQARTTITQSQLNDYALVSDMINNPAPPSGVSLRVYVYDSTGAERWNYSAGAGPGCDAPDTSGLGSLTTAGNDIIIAQACSTFVPYVATFLGDSILGASSFSVQQDVMVRPRSTATLDCTDCP